MTFAAVSRMERLLALRACSTFAAVSPAQLGRIADHLRVRDVLAGTRLVRGGVPANSIAFLLRGAVDVTSATTSVRLCAPGTLGSVVDLFAERTAPTVVARERTLTLELERSDFEDLLEDEFGVFLEILRAMARELSAPWLRRLDDGDAGRESSVVSAGELSLVQRILVLRRELDFGGSEVEALAAVAQRCSELTVESQASLWSEGEPSRDFVVLLDGRVRAEPLTRALPARNGGVIGIFEALTGEPRRWSAVAETDVRGLTIPAAALLDVIEDSPNLGMHLLRALARAGVVLNA